MDTLLQLFWLFIKVNLLSTSGPASVGLLHTEAVGMIMTEAQFIQAVGLSSVLPGSDALQLAMFVGYAAGGVAGALVALLGSILPPTLLMFGVVAVLHRLRREAWVSRFVEGLTPAVSVLMLFVAWKVFAGGNGGTITWQAGLLGLVSLIALDFECPCASRSFNRRIGRDFNFLMSTKKPSFLVRLFWMFLKVNLLSTSGPASVGLFYKEAVGNIMSEKDFIEAVGFSSVLPGSDALQLAMFVGYSAGGVTGTAVALLGSILPPTLLMLGLISHAATISGRSVDEGICTGISSRSGYVDGYRSMAGDTR